MSSGIRVLHVDDDDLFRDLATRHLERQGLEVTTVESAAAALDALEAADVDCVVSDFDMPGTDGLELLEAVRERDPDLPFVLFTGKGSEEIASDAISAGVTDYLQKETSGDQFALLANRIERAVTERRTEAALEESERMLSTLVSNLPGIVYRCRNEPGWPMEYIGGNVEEVTGFEPGDFLAGDVVWGEHIDEADRDDTWETVQDAVAEREPFEVTYRFVDADGETRWLREQGRGVFESSDDEDPIALEGFITDVTDRKRRERELTEYDRLVDAMGDPVYTTDGEGRITTFNDRAEAVTGYDAEEVLGEHVSKLLAPSDIERGEAVIRELLGSEDGTATYELTVRTADRGEIDLENHVALLSHDGEFHGTIGVLRSTDDGTDSRLRRLHDATRSLMGETDTQRIAEQTVEAAREILGMPVASVRFARGDDLELVAATDETFEEVGERPPFPIDSSVAGRTYRDGEPTVEPDLGELEKPMDPGAARSAAYFPLGEHGVFITAATERDAFDESDIRLATVLSANAEAALDRAQKEAALRRERDDLAALFENIPDPTVETVMTGGRPIVDRVNPAFERVFGYDTEDLQGEDIDDYIVPEDARRDAREYNERIEGGEGFHDEVRRLADDGLRDFILHVVPHDVGEETTRGYAIYTDITEQKQRQRELERQNERIEALHEVAMRMKTAGDRERIYEIVIDAAEEIMAFDICIIDELDGDVLKPVAVGSEMSIEDYYEETSVDRENNLGAKTARERETYVIDDLQESGYAPANFGYTSAISVPLGDFGVFQAVAEERAAFSEADRQLTELLVEHAVAAINRQKRERQLETRAAELERQNERLDQFASVVSHDLRNPLSVARGRLDLAEMTRGDEHFEAVERAHDRMEELIDGLLALARQGEMANDPVPVDLESAADAAWDTAETVDLSLAFDDPPTVQADPERLRQLLENLFRNAAEHGSTSPGSQARQDAAEHGGEDVSTVTVGGLADGFYVADDGVGIPESERDSVLQSGYSGADGTGFGLAIAETIAEAHGWTVDVAESEGGGARFEFREDPTLERD